MRVVIGGAQRSGTSLMRSIIGSHSEVAMFPYDLRLWTHFGPQHKGESLSLREAESLLERIVLDKKAVIADDVPEPSEVRALLEKSAKVVFSASQVFDCFLEAYAIRRRKLWWGLKTPWNEFHASEIMEGLSDVVFLHLIRNPLRSAASAKHAEGGSWFYDPFIHIGRWQKSAQVSLENVERYPGKYHVVRYEDLVADPVATCRYICNQIGLKYQTGMELGLKQPGWTGSNSSFADSADSSKPLGKKAIPGYLHTVYSRELAEEMQVYGYKDSSGSRKPSFRQELFVACHKMWLSTIYLLIRLKKLFVN